MGCCLVLILAWLSPRFALAFLWVFTDRLSVAFRSGLVGAVGFLFLPYTSVMWALAYAPGPGGGVNGIGWAFVGIGVLADLGSYAGGNRRRHRRRDDDD
jgi:hypothetical protein